MVDHIANRDVIISRLKEELVGPSPLGDAIDCTQPIIFEDTESSYGPWRQKGSGEEILLRDPPSKRYGIGVLFPLGTTAEDDRQGELQSVEAAPRDATAGEQIDRASESSISDEALTQTEVINRRVDYVSDETDDFDLSSANSYRPSSMGISLLAELPHDAVLVVEATGGRYHQKELTVAGKTRIWWLRSKVRLRAEFAADALHVANASPVKPTICEGENLDGLELSIEVFSRPQGVARQYLLTICLVNRQPAGSSSDRFCLFQSFFKARVVSPGEGAHILPYPVITPVDLDEEEQSLSLLYRNAQTFATGHGCAANWGMGEGPAEAGSIEYARVGSGWPHLASKSVQWASAECFPMIEIPGMTPNIRREDGSQIDVSMSVLAGLVPGDNGIGILSEVVDLYQEWIANQRSSLASFNNSDRETALRNLQICERSVQRMRDGLSYLRSDLRAWTAFQLANYAILLQQTCSRREPRKATYNAESQRIVFSEAYADPSSSSVPRGRGQWRAFQIAFLLMSIRSVAEGTAVDRETVELIWFPTGGGKTEAYLGLAAFGMFMQRLKNPNDSGVHVLMRYTLRLLTAQQFQRAAGLLCAMEYLRRQNTRVLGNTEFSIGIWLGGSTTPNKRDEARSILSKLQSANRSGDNKFILNRCPWCGAQLGPLQYSGKIPKNAPKVIGYERVSTTVAFVCPDSRCAFSSRLPIYVIDEDIYEYRPSMIIGTVDKFAMLAWQPRARAIFGLDESGKRICSPPNLIIQDELHLISGPLGSMVGLYETVVEELCTDYRDASPVRPKIVSSTATIRRYADQVKSLYARDDVALFPPPGIDAGDSFFARYDTLPDGRLRRGRMYVGVHAPGLGSIQTAQVRTFSSLLQAAVDFDPEAQDPWWTLLLFFNSLRELGTTVSLLQSDIPDYLKVLRNRYGIKPNQMRWLNNVQELTGRLNSDEVPQAIADLEVTTSGSGRPVDVCLASNIVEVGIDIDRLSLMAVVGQPKTTSQYIQVTGRVGRRTQERPGLVVTIYGASKPRDRSHFEKFRSYHERLYANVEPTSLTPFSPPALDRALHAVMVAYVRQLGSEVIAARPYPFPTELVAAFEKILARRVTEVDLDEEQNAGRIMNMRSNQWQEWKRLRWEAKPQDSDLPLLRMAGSYVSKERELYSWPTPTSMRNVDAECQGEITQLYIQGSEPTNV